jgi:hypothetical protein
MQVLRLSILNVTGCGISLSRMAVAKSCDNAERRPQGEAGV